MKQPRIAIYYDNRFGRNDGPPLYYFHAIKSMGLDVSHLLPEGDTKAKFGKFDLHLWVDWGEDGLPWQSWYPPRDGGKTIYIASDTHLGWKYRQTKAMNFEYRFFNQKVAYERFSGLFQEMPHNSWWLPHAAEPKAYPHTVQLKKYDVCFIGHIQEQPNHQGMTRVEALDRLFKAFPNFYYGSRHPAFPGKNLFEDAARTFNQSRIVFNISIGDDVNMRVFETLCAGAFLLTNDLPTLGELFTPGTHLATYGSYDEMVEKARYYLKHDAERERIAAAGHELVMARHTYTHRVQTILKTLAFPYKPQKEVT